MSEDPTRNLTTDEKLDLILARLAKLEAFAEDRQRDTRPMLDRIHKELADTRVEMRTEFTEIKSRLVDLERRFEAMASEYFGIRANMRVLEERVSEIERKPS
jgi:hypothetical protein